MKKRAKTPTKPENLPITEIPARWGVCLVTVKRRLRKFKAMPIAFTGMQPIFSIEEINRVEAAHKNSLLTQWKAVAA